MTPILVSQVLFSLALWKLVVTSPQKPQTQNTTLTTNFNPTKNNPTAAAATLPSKTEVLQLMGNPEPQNCQNSQISWAKGQPLWGKLQLAERLSLFQNVWNDGQLQAGSSNSLLCRAFSGGEVSWKVKFQMQSLPSAKNQVKSYSNLGWYGSPKRVADLRVFKSFWSWKLADSSSDLIADVSYDIFTATDRNCKEQTCATNEVMIWLAAIGGALPASLTGKSIGTISIRGTQYTYQFDVWKGVVSNKPVVSLFPTNQLKYTVFDADFKDLFKKLEPFGIDKNQYIVNVGAGTEVFQGGGTLDTSSYVLNIVSNDGSRKKTKR